MKKLLKTFECLAGVWLGIIIARFFGLILWDWVLIFSPVIAYFGAFGLASVVVAVACLFALAIVWLIVRLDEGN